MLRGVDLVVSPLTAGSLGDDVLRFWNRYAAPAHTFQHPVERDELVRRDLPPGGEFQTWNRWVARREGAIVGLACMERPRRDAHRRDAEIDFMIDPDAGTGAARALLRRAMAPPHVVRAGEALARVHRERAPDSARREPRG